MVHTREATPLPSDVKLRLLEGRLMRSQMEMTRQPETAARKPPILARANDDGGIIGELFVARAFPSFVQLGLLSLWNSNGATSTR